jgi:hypothetical protein
LEEIVVVLRYVWSVDHLKKKSKRKRDQKKREKKKRRKKETKRKRKKKREKEKETKHPWLTSNGRHLTPTSGSTL